MKFEDEYDPWCLFGTDDPLIDDAQMMLSNDEIQQFDAEWETWTNELEQRDADIPY